VFFMQRSKTKQLWHKKGFIVMNEAFK